MPELYLPNDIISGSGVQPSEPALNASPSNLVIGATDGSSLGNPGSGGWGWYIDEDTWLAGGLDHATSQQAELSGLISILREVPANVSLHLLLDSQYSLKSATIWIPQWKSRNWRKTDGKPVLNLGLMQDLDEAINARVTLATMEWVPGHRGHPLNEHADRRCGAASLAKQRNEPVPIGPGWSDGPSGRHVAPSKRVSRY